MLTTAIAILAGSVITLSTAKNAINSANEATGTVVGNQLQTVVDGLNSYISANSSGLNSGNVTGVANAYAPTVDELKSLGFIGSWIVSAPTHGGAYINIVSKTVPSCTSNCAFYGMSHLRDPFVSTEKSGLVDIRFLQSAANASKTSQIGYSLPGSSTQISGPGWVLTNPDTTLRSGILLATTNVVAKTGHGCPAYDVGKGIDCTSDTQLATNATGAELTAIGIKALQNNTSGVYNVAVGSGALQNNSSGSNNVAVGFGSLQQGNSFGNTGVGLHALANSNGGENVAIGQFALRSNTVGNANVAIGALSLSNNTTSYGNTALGYSALSSNTTGPGNTAVGYLSMMQNSSGNGNTSLGVQSLQNNKTGNSNLALGQQAFGNNTTGSGNVILGANSAPATQSGAYNIVVGYGAAGNGSTIGSYNVLIGYRAGYLATNTHSGGGQNVAIGTSALYQNTSGYWNYAIGTNALYNNTTGGWNIAIGQGALSSNVAGGGNVAVGQAALSGSNGSNNTAVGSDSMSHSGSSINNNAAFGSNSLKKVTGSQNTAVGQQAAANQTSGTNNALLGYATGSNILGGSQNTALGAYSGPTSDLTNTVSIGYNATASTSNSVQIGNSSMTKIGGQVAWSNLSDRRLKEDIRDSGRGLDFVKKLRPVDYTLISNNKAETGFIAQEVEEVDGAFPGVNKPANDADFYSLTYTDFIPALVKSIQELSDKVDGLDRHDCKASDLPLTIWLAIGGGLILFGWNVSLQRAVNKLKKAA